MTDDPHSRDSPGAPNHAALAHDQELVRRIRLGDGAALEAVFRAYFRMLFRLVYDLVRSRAITEEVLQDLFASLWERRETLEVHGALKSYLYRAARNRALSHLRHERVETRWQVASLRESADSTADPAVDALIADEEFGVALARAIEQLPPRAREAYLLRWRHQMPYAEIAKTMGISVKAVEHRISHALKVLRDALRDFAP